MAGKHVTQFVHDMTLGNRKMLLTGVRSGMMLEVLP